MSLGLNIYHRLPIPARSLAASIHGYYLGWWRYDRLTDKLVDEALEREYWTDKQWNNWRENRLSDLLHRAVRDVPYYREMWAERKKEGDSSSWEDLQNWSVLEKKVLRDRGTEFIADGFSRSRMYHEHTSGTTGTPLHIWLTRESVKQWFALFEARCRRWYGFSRKDRWAILGGQLVVPVKQMKPPFWVWNQGMNQLYMSSYHLSPVMTQHYLKALAKYRIKYILGYSSAIYSLAQAAVEKKVSGLQIETVITNAEPLYAHQRETISKAFGCPVRETYGMTEVAAAASECEFGRLHLWPEVGIIETESNAAPSGASDFICTGLINAEMPLIRYRVGDRGRLSDEKCDCGRNLPLIDSIDGRCDDVLYTSDGRSVGRLDPIFKGGLPILEAQIIQNSLKRITVKFVRAEAFETKALDSLAERVRERLGDIEVTFEETTAIPRTSNGKFRAVVCELSSSEREQVLNPINVETARPSNA